MTRLLWLVVALCSMVYALLVTGRAVNFDEHLHMHFGWLVASGRVPGADFFCNYPQVYYWLTRGLYDWIPLDGSFLLRGRLFVAAALLAVVVVAGLLSRRLHGTWLPGVVACLLPATVYNLSAYHEFRPDMAAYALAIGGCLLVVRDRVSLPGWMGAGFLTALSLLIMPKHIYMLAGALGAVVLFGTGRQNWLSVTLARGSAYVAGSAVAVLLACLSGADVVASVSAVRFGYTDVASTGHALARNLFDLWKDPRTAVVFAMALVGLPALWHMRARRESLLVMGGLVGAVVYLTQISCGYTQYLLPLMLLASFVAVYGASRRALFSIAALLAACYSVYASTTWLRQPGDLAAHAEFQRTLMRLVPEGETVVSCPFTHPWFRPDPGWVYYDSKPSYRRLAPQDVEKFSQAYFAERLEAKAPGMFCFYTMDNQPPEYTQAAVEYLSRHGTNYIQVAIPIGTTPIPVILRKDLLEGRR